MKRLYRNSIKGIALALFSMFALSACSDWTEVEGLGLDEPTLADKNPELYAKYLQNLRDYKNSDHKIVYAWFDNSEKTPFSRGQHISDAPDSLDVISMMYPAELAEFELADMKTVREKGTKVVYTISFDKIKKEYTEKVKEGVETGTFDTYLSTELTKQIGYADAFDGMIVEYKGTNPIYMTAEQKAEVKKQQDTFFGALSTWRSSNDKKLFTFQGYPENLIGQTLLAGCNHIILATDNVADDAQLSVTARLAMVAPGIPTDRFIVAVSTVSLDGSDKLTGYYGSDRALAEAAYWTMESSADYTRAGIAIYNVQNDYYNAVNIYQYVREAINIMNPAPKK
ncbi:glycoside hydrolase family 18 [Bacteroides sp.]|uniref:glycoside hydrolase family 18 n=1 Tax=Bacteroides sp. TaxID=29523 RepID=UPI00260B176F|nr:glycoside hydrolase family 18 [Bacteroides sp.]